ncbi:MULTISPECIES: hypothetical protein [unclassified Paenibacillus]|uniref:hypothetical protein n=1 Tax=unclassified Paenibacillus TaxID=185978 RepID=UPI001160053A|nr:MULTISPECIES: hypothetical protein [unclassified Paenibacillus]
MKENLSPERLIHTFEFEGFPGQVALTTIQFEELPDGKTKFVESTVYPCRASSGWVGAIRYVGGAIELLDRFEEVLGKLQNA